ncbi:phosphatase PAP2 family protein [Lachnospiraceae bacterium ZAX-1]
MKNFFTRYKHGLLLLYVFIYIPWFNYLEKTVVRRFHEIHMEIDDYIPFIEYFIVPYLLWFVYIAIAVFYFFLKNTTDYYKLCMFLFIGMTIFLIISTIYPNGHYLRPHVYERNNIFVAMVQRLHIADTPTNLFPSVHVYNSIGVHIAISHNEHLKQNWKLQLASLLLMLSIIFSTVFLKQHSVFDVITGGMLAAVMYPLVYGIDFQKGRRKAYEEQYHQI